jgi:hypothetical protein
MQQPAGEFLGGAGLRSGVPDGSGVPVFRVPLERRRDPDAVVPQQQDGQLPVARIVSEH